MKLTKNFDSKEFAYHCCDEISIAAGQSGGSNYINQHIIVIIKTCG